MDCGPRRYLAAISLWGESNNLESRIERVSGMYFLEKLAGRLGKRDEHVSDVLRKERCPGSREREYLQAMHHRGCVSVTPRILHVVVNRMIVSRTAWKAEACASVSVRLGARKISPTRRSSNVRAGTTVKLLGSKVCAVSGMSVVEFMLSSFPLLLFEGWCVASNWSRTCLFGVSHSVSRAHRPTP